MEKVIYDVNDIMQIFQIGKTTAYKLMNSNCFPSMKIGRKILVTKENFEKFITQNGRKEIIL